MKTKLLKKIRANHEIYYIPIQRAWRVENKKTKRLHAHPSLVWCICVALYDISNKYEYKRMAKMIWDRTLCNTSRRHNRIKQLKRIKLLKKLHLIHS